MILNTRLCEVHSARLCSLAHLQTRGASQRKGCLHWSMSATLSLLYRGNIVHCLENKSLQLLEDYLLGEWGVLIDIHLSSVTLYLVLFQFTWYPMLIALFVFLSQRSCRQGWHYMQTCPFRWKRTFLWRSLQLIFGKQYKAHQTCRFTLFLASIFYRYVVEDIVQCTWQALSGTHLFCACTNTEIFICFTVAWHRHPSSCTSVSLRGDGSGCPVDGMAWKGVFDFSGIYNYNNSIRFAQAIYWERQLMWLPSDSILSDLKVG